MIQSLCSSRNVYTWTHFYENVKSPSILLSYKWIPSNITRHRLIALLCSISKVQDKSFSMPFAFVLHIITLNQFFFVKGHSCIQRILITLMLICGNSSTHTTIDVIHLYLDFQKTFDSVSNEELLI